MELINLSNITKVIEDHKSAEKQKTQQAKLKYKLEWQDQAKLVSKYKLEDRVI